tara:strand:+ start:1098 stop:1274 length:177 start_codon:yes stop_codon:yes gene_type:complete
MIELEPQYSITWHVSPLDENPEVVTFDFWHELEGWIQDKENTVDCFDINLCTIKELNA